MYSTDLTETQWPFIKSSFIYKEIKRKYNLRTLWNAIHYVIKTGCQWSLLLSDFLKWQLVYSNYNKWASLELYDLILETLHHKVRVKIGQKAEASLGIMDSQSVRLGNDRSLNGIRWQ